MCNPRSSSSCGKRQNGIQRGCISPETSCPRKLITVDQKEETARDSDWIEEKGGRPSEGKCPPKSPHQPVYFLSIPNVSARMAKWTWEIEEYVEKHELTDKMNARDGRICYRRTEANGPEWDEEPTGRWEGHAASLLELNGDIQTRGSVSLFKFFSRKTGKHATWGEAKKQRNQFKTPSREVPLL